MSPKEKEGPYSKYNRRQQKLSLMESRKKMPYVEPKPDVPEDSSGMHLYRLKVTKVRFFSCMIFFTPTEFSFSSD